MTFNSSAWAIDEASVPAALARVETFAANSGQPGVVQFSDLKVTQSSTPGHSLLIGAGSALVLNGYSGVDDQMYVVTNPTAHTVTSGDMPSVSGSTQSYILAVVIGDQEFAQTGHPFMGGGDPPSGEESTFQYVRPVMIACGATDTTLSVAYPALPLARITIPSGVSTVTNAMITDLRALARPRTKLEMGQATAGGAHNITNTAWQRVPDATCVTAIVPPWATKAKIVGFVEGLRLTADAGATFGIYIESNNRSGETVVVNENLAAGTDDRRSYNVGAVLDVSDLQGTQQKFSIRGQAASAPSSAKIKTDTATSGFLSVYFEETPI